MRTLLVGGAGFLGSHLAEALVDSGHSVTVVDNLSSGRIENLKDIIDQIQFNKEDILEYTSDVSFDYIINLASRASRAEWEKYPVEVALSNSLGTQRLIKLALKSKSHFLYASTSEVYGNPEVIPTPETYVGRIDPLGSRAPYDESKRFGETLIKSYEKEHGLSSVIIRFFNTYGPRMRGGDLYGRVIDRFIQQARSGEPITVYGDGEQTRSFTYVSDTVSAVQMLMEKAENGDVYNVGSNNESRILDIAKLVKEITGSQSSITHLDLPPDDPKRRSADITKISSLGWKQKVDLRTGLRKMVDYWSAHE